MSPGDESCYSGCESRFARQQLLSKPLGFQSAGISRTDRVDAWLRALGSKTRLTILFSVAEVHGLRAHEVKIVSRGK